MKIVRSYLMLSSAAVSAWILVTACGGADTAATSRSKTDSGSSVDDDNDNGSSNTSTPSTDYTSTYDAGTTTYLEASTARVLCGASECALGQACCGVGDAGKCVDPGGSCTGVKIACDDSTDCASGQKCCASALGASCSADCLPVFQFQLCANTTECGSAGECTDKKCVEIIGTGQEYKLRTCGAAPLGCQ